MELHCRKWIIYSCLVTLFAILGPSLLQAQSASSGLNDPKIDERVNALLKRMSLEEKIGQLVQYSVGDATGPEKERVAYKDRLSKGQIGSLYNLTGAREVNAMQRIAVDESRLHVPLVFALDVIHGYRTTFPVPLGLSATWNPALVEEDSRIAAEEATSEGIRWTFSPMVDIARDARWGRITEGAGEDAYLGAAMARAYVRGYQGANLSDSNSMIACAKHYVGYGSAEGGRDYNTTDMSERALRQVYLPPFKAAVDAGAVTLMSAFNSLQYVPASANHFTLTEVLRDEWGFRGFVVSDWAAITELIDHGIANDEATAARKALTAGVDMDMVSGAYANTLLDQVRSGKIPESVVDEAARRVLRVKFAMGLFEHPYADESKSPITTVDPEHLAAARTSAEESFVLLKNEISTGGKPLLPLASNVRTIALIGPMADSAADMLGSWSAAGQAKDVVTLRTALSDRLEKSGGKLLYAKGAEFGSPSENGFAEALSMAQQSDIVLMALGEPASDTGEAGSRTRLGLPENQEKLLHDVVATGKPVIMIVFDGRPLTLVWEAANVPAIIEAWYPGVQAGPAVVRTLFGDVNPSGRLTASFPRTVGQEPLYYNALNTGRPATVDLSHPPKNTDEKYLSRYLDETNSALYPFGYGLSYTKFQFSPPAVSSQSISAKALNDSLAKLTVAADVKNAGDRAGAEVVELYIREQGTSVARPVRELKGFSKIMLAPGESKRVEFTLGRDELAFWNIDMKNVVEPCNLTVWIAPSSVEGSPAEVTVEP